MPQISFSGLASGIDSDAVIKTLLDSRKLLSAPVEKTLARNEDENSGLENINSKLLTLQDKLKLFTSAFGSGISKKAQSSVPDAVGVSAGNNAALSSTTIEVLKVAKGASFSFNDRFSRVDVPIAPNLTSPTTISIGFGSGDQQKNFEITLDNQTTLSDLAASINTEAGNSVQAVVLNTGTESNPEYLLQIIGLESGTEKGVLEVKVAEDLLSQNVFNSSTLEQAQDAVFKIQGLGKITRSNNLVSDVIPGVTFELKTENSGPVQLSVTEDSEKTNKHFAEVVQALNDLILYQKENDAVTVSKNDKGQTQNSFGKLSYTRLDNQIIDSLRNAILESNSNIEKSAVNVSADLGLSSQKDGTYKLNESDFLEALNKDPAGANQLLQNISNRLANTNGLIDQYTRFNGNIDLGIKNNDQENSSLKERLERMDRELAKQEQNLRIVFANLEKTVGKLNSQASALASILPSAGNN